MRPKDWDKHWEKPGKCTDGVGAGEVSGGTVRGAHVDRAAPLLEHISQIPEKTNGLCSWLLDRFTTP